jgi:hypothetical protein
LPHFFLCETAAERFFALRQGAIGVSKGVQPVVRQIRCENHQATIGAEYFFTETAAKGGGDCRPRENSRLDSGRMRRRQVS